MNKLTGFYELNKLTNKELKQFFTDAILLSYKVYIETINDSRIRTGTRDKTIQEMLDTVSTDNNNVCINRAIQLDTCDYGEIGYSTITNEDYLLYIYVTLDNLKILTDKYNLIMK